MEYVGIALAVVIVCIVITQANERKTKRQLRERLRERFGKLPENEMNSLRMESLGAYLKSLPERAQDIDEITWNDLDMDRVFHEMNNTCSAIGEEYLYALLHRPELAEEELLRREALIAAVSESEEVRLDLQMSLTDMGKMRNISVYDYMMRLSGVREEKNYLHFLALVLYAVGFGISFVPGYFGIGIAIVIVTAAWNMMVYYKRKAEIEPYLQVVSFLMRWITQVEVMASDKKEKAPALQQELQNLKGYSEQFRSFVRGAKMLAPTSPTGSFADMFMDYIRILFHVDLIKFNQIYRIFMSRQKELLTMFRDTGRLDAMIAVASFRAHKHSWCIPELRADSLVLKANDLYHPLVEEPVTNSIHADRAVLLTGSNASGKSTFLKTVAINAIFAQTIHTVLAQSYSAGYYRILSSMALRDDLETQESYYIVEIRSLKRILGATEDEIPVLCFVDEVLRGTNTAERIAASTEILRHLAEEKVLCFAATHDLELTTLLQQHFDNYHFSEQVTEEGVVFDYCLKEGKATSRNAIRLLDMMGYPKHLITGALGAVEHFLTTGEWKHEG